MPHIHDKIDWTVEVMIVYNNKVLLRKHDKYHIWLSVGGHIELDEDPNQAALREVKEEVGLDITLYSDSAPIGRDKYGEQDLIRPFAMNKHPINKDHEHIALVYFARANTDKLILSVTEKSEDCRWWTKEEVERSTELRDHIRYYALKALETIKS